MSETAYRPTNPDWESRITETIIEFARVLNDLKWQILVVHYSG